MKLREIRELSEADLEKKVAELKRELAMERGTSSSAKGAGKLRNLRKIIARMLCVKREKELGIHQSEKGMGKPGKGAPLQKSKR